VVVAYGRIVPVRVLDRLPMVNLHFSLLPRWRGAAPVERAILAGDAETGVCVMAVEEGLDTGPVYAKTAVPVGAGEHLAALRQRLVDIGSALLVEVLAGGVAGLPTAEPQQGEPVYAEKLRPEEFALAWDRSAEHLARVVRLDRAFTTFRGRRLRVLEAEAVPPAPAPAPAPAPSPAPAPGTMAGDEVVTGGGRLRLVTVQPEGRAPMPAADWRRGARPAPDERLG
jgi:methionyl-tRNA formyltransferase